MIDREKLSAIIASSNNGQAASKIREQKEDANLQNRFTKLSHDFEVLANRLGVWWDFRSKSLRPSEDTLATHAQESRMALLSLLSLVTLGGVYYPLIIALGLVYALIVVDLQGWDGLLGWIGYIGVALMFIGGSLLVSSLWKKLAIARYRETDKTFRRFRLFTVGLTGTFLLIDFAASFVLFSSAVEATSLGGSRIPHVAVLLMAGLTTFSQLLGAFLGYDLGLRHEARTSWRRRILQSKSQEVNELKTIATEVKQIGRRLHELEKLPRAHVDRGG